MSSNLVENFFGAINTISQANVNAAQRDVTIDAEIQSVVNIDIGEYKVSYQGNIFSATAADSTVTYQKGDKVYVLVPGGDYSKKKIILGSSAYKNNTTYSDLSDMTNFYIIKGPNWLDQWYKPVQLPLEICACEDRYKTSLLKDAHFQDYGFLREPPSPREGYPTVDYPTTFMTDEQLAEADEQLARYSATYDSIMISATFRTEFASTHTKGEYRLRVQCITDNPKYITDPAHPDFKTSMGEEWLKLNKKYEEYVASIDQQKYEDDPAYAAEVDAKKLEMQVARDNKSAQKKYQLLNFDLGFKQFSGAPYAFVADTPQKGYFSTKNAIKGLYSISLWQDGQMIADIIPTYLSDGTITYDAQNSVRDRNNIFCDNIDIRFAQKVNLTDTLFYAWIETPYGDTVYDANAVEGRPTGRASVDLIAHLQHGLQDLVETSPEAIEVHWFRKKADVTSTTPTNEEVDKHNNTWFDYGGPGWYPIEKLIEEGDLNYAVDFNVLTVRKEAVPYRWTYKAVIVYRDMSTSAESEINRSEVEQDVIRLDSQYDLKVEQFTSKDGRKTYLRILDQNKSVHVNDPITGEPYREWFGTWYLMLQDGSYTRISDPYWEGPLEVNDFLLNDIAIFYVAAYDPYEVDPDGVGDLRQVQEVTVLRHDIISADPDDASLLCDWIGRDTFNYDALGVIKDWAAEKDNTLEPEISWAEGHGSDYVITIFGPDGITPLSNREYYDENSDTESGQTGKFPTSMMDNIWVDFENTIHFKVLNQYDIEKAKAENNVFTVRIQTVNGVDYEFKKTINFVKDGDMGTIGAEWSAQIKPCNWKHSPDNEEGCYLEALDYPAPLVIYEDEATGKLVQDKNFRVFLRPFVKKNGIPLEQMDPLEGYFYKTYWDVRMPASFESTGENRGRYAANLRLYHADGTQDTEHVGSLFGRDGSFWENGGMNVSQGYTPNMTQANGLMANTYSSKVNEFEQSPNGLIGFTVYPSRQYATEAQEFAYENYGAIEVRFFDNLHDGTQIGMESLLYRFIVKAQVDIMKGQYDQGKKMIQVEGNVERINSIVSYFPVDVIVNTDKIDFTDSDNYEMFGLVQKIATNWPQYVTYNASGYDPSVFPDAMWFKFGPNRDKEEKSYEPWNLTPLTQTIETQLNPVTQKIEHYYRAKPHLNMAEGFWGVLRTRPGDSPFGKGYFMRNQVMYLDAYGNVDINGWDGQGIDMNEENGTIFAITVGAGYKRPSTNAFTGVLMGADRSLKRANVTGDSFAHDEEANKHMPYLTGLFGYQDGVKSFALMENGTAFFGRADRGGRIMIDGTNATIYGGGNGEMGSPTIGDPMWNSMRLTLCDLTHATSPKSGAVSGYWQYADSYEEGKQGQDVNNEKQLPSYVGIQQGYDEDGNPLFYEQGFNGSYFLWNPNADTSPADMLPNWYRELWENAYIKPDGQPPYWLGTGTREPQKYGDLDWFRGEEGMGNDCQRIDYFWGGSNKDLLIFQRVTPDDQAGMSDEQYQEELDKLNDKNGADQNNSHQLSGFAPSRASTTPAIEIGQHRHGLMPGILDWCSYEKVFKTLNIPGDRNFMVTYDGTVWAMNGIFMGVLIGSNIVGGRIQGAEIGIGHNPNANSYSYVMEEEHGALTDCKFEELWAPHDVRRPINDNHTPGKCEKGYGGLGFYVDGQGNVIANSIRIYGGSIDIGRFHIMGTALASETAIIDEDYGHLVQIAESDFLGPTHIYGNIGIGPCRNFNDIDWPPNWREEKLNQGNLFQTHGFVGLGIPMENETDYSIHEIAVGGDKLMKGPQNYLAGKQFAAGDPGIGRNSLEQTAMFGIDSFSTYLPKVGASNPKSTNRLQGHFWPMHFHYGETDEQVEGQKKDTLNAYMTTMDIFQSTGMTVTNGSPGHDNEAMNYFRVGPWGSEGMVHYFRQNFQPEQESEAPDSGLDGHLKNGNYLGWIGLQNRAGTGDTTEDQYAIGMSSWYSAPIIFASDGESAWRTRGHFHFFTRAVSGNAGETGYTWNGEATNSALNYGVVLNMGTNITNFEGKSGRDLWAGNQFYVRTAHGPVGLGVDIGDPGIDDTWSCPNIFNTKTPTGLELDPYGCTVGEDNAGVYLWTQLGGIHISRQREGSIEHFGHREHVELYLKEESMIGNVFNGCWFGIQVDPHNDFDQADPGDQGSFGMDLGSAGVYHPKRVAITSGTTWSKTIADAGGGFGLVAQDKSWLHMGYNAGYLNMEPNKVSFEGTYAEPDNQYHIYARFG